MVSSDAVKVRSTELSSKTITTPSPWSRIPGERRGGGEGGGEGREGREGGREGERETERSLDPWEYGDRVSYRIATLVYQTKGWYRIILASR